ncbi:MAG: hypothetical protein FJY67_01785 [Calditrichaeota bacterium]|nr:hypothetical protein [Calditrichota bacterium]
MITYFVRLSNPSRTPALH